MGIVGSIGGVASPFLGFNPQDFSGLVMHFDSLVFSSFTLAGGPGTKISQWDDLSGNGHHAVQALVARQPVYMATIFNGKPACSGNGTHFLNTGFILPDGYEGSAFCAWRTPPIYSGQDGPYGVLRSNERFYVYTNDAPDVVWGAGNGGDTSAAPSNNSFLYTSQLIDSNQNCWQNNVQKVTNQGHTFTTPIEEFYINALNVNGSDARHLQGPVAEFFLYDRVVTEAERFTAVEYMRLRWGDLPLVAA